MNFSHDGLSVMFNEPEELFEVERSGAKSNTLRIIDAYEADQIQNKLPTKIVIQCQGKIFRRTLTDIHFSAKILGKVIAIFSWTNGEHYHTLYYNPHTEEAPAKEEPSIDKIFAAITISKDTLSLIQSIAHGRTMNMVIKELYEAYVFQRSEEWGPLHD